MKLLLTESEVITGKSQTSFGLLFVLWIIKLALAVALFVAPTKEVSVC